MQNEIHPAIILDDYSSIIPLTDYNQSTLSAYHYKSAYNHEIFFRMDKLAHEF